MSDLSEASPEAGSSSPAPPRRPRLLADIRPLRESAEYRRLWIGSSSSSIGTQMTAVALPVQIYDLTHSSLAVGLLGLTVAVPLITLGLVGGSLADTVDRRKLVLLTSSLLAVLSLMLAAQAFLNLDQLWLLYFLSALQSCLVAVDQPARRTFPPRLLPPERIRAAAALSLLVFHLSVIIGPLMAGVIIATVGLKMAYAIDAASFLLAIYGVWRLRPMRTSGDSTRPSVHAVAEGLRFVRHQPILSAVLLADLNAMIFGMPRALFPALAATHFGGGAQTIGWLYAAPGIGGFLSATFSGPQSHIRRQGLAVLLGGSVWGAAIAGFGLAHQLWLAVLLLAIAGAFDVISVVFRTTIMQITTPDSLRGRVGSLDFVVGAGGPRLGDVESGAVAAATSPTVSAVSGGLVCVAGAILLAVLFPVFARYDARAKAGTADRTVATLEQ